ncbi:MAG: DUF2905 domain-containing protein [Deltaproteobacteria bacterium CG_4_10_14_3_um_filter_60_8]|nr:MAG: hypothetical protein AUK28_06510 [Desulfobacterales bacterium CG2_30_60_27]PIP43488.1 MAG: hypothetical protein COX17_06690 [Deltaproteobacteria bacterium CG23_combo_of_CG06-09_8_20_14_all_60_8]PIY21431.1 MAG: DUF2905 domain-containing protein [Deltaproteobacteria bacterium CG_4_10_14_3_um_filter_60_8]
MNRTLVVIGLLCLIAGLLWPWLGQLPVGRLPGDIIVSRPHYKIFIPITTMILVSLALSILFWLFKK